MKFTYAAETRPVDGFTIRRGIHRGGFGEVYYAVSDAGKEVALKLLTHDLDTELRGIRQCLNLKHPNLVTIFDVKTDSDGDTWVVMEYVNGATLEEVLTSFPGGLPFREVTDWLHGIVNGVEYLHDRGLIHRDLKPANIYRENGVVKIGDVGLSKRIDGHRNPHTESIGTVYYMAPEITHGQYGPAVDVYSLGILLYEMLTGKLPFNGETSGEILMKQLSAAPDLSLVSPALKPVLAHALEKDPLKRTSSARQLWIEFERVASPEKIPDSHFVHGSRASSPQGESAKRDTGKTHDTDSKPSGQKSRVARAAEVAHRLGEFVGAVVSEVQARHPAKKVPPAPPPRPPVPRQYWEFKIGLIVLAISLLFIPWQSMSWGDRGEVAGLVGFAGGFLLLLLWAREHWRPDERPLKSAKQSGPNPPRPTDWAGTLAIAAFAGCIFTSVVIIVTTGVSVMSGHVILQGSPRIDTGGLILMAAVTIFGAWAVTSGAWLTRINSWAARHPRWLYAGLGLMLATTIYHLQDYLMMPPAMDIPASARPKVSALFDHLGVNPLLHQGVYPTWWGHAVFFCGFFFLMGKRFVRMQDPQRPSPWMIRHLIAAGVWSWVWMHIFVYPAPLGLLWAAAITASVQLAAPWQPALTSHARK